MYDVTGSSLWVGLLGVAALVPLVVLGLYGGSVVGRGGPAHAADLGLAGGVGRHGGPVRPGAAGRRRPLGPARAWSALQSAAFAMSSPTRGALVPRLLPLELVPAGNTLNFTMSNFGSVLGPLIAGVVLVHGGYAVGVRDRRGAVHRRALRRAAAARDAAARRDGAAGAAVGARRARLHRHPAGPADVVRRRHRGDGAGHAAGAVPGGGRRAVQRSRQRRAGCSPPSASARWWVVCSPAGSAG